MLKTLLTWILGKGVGFSYTIRFGGGKRKSETRK